MVCFELTAHVDGMGVLGQDTCLGAGTVTWTRGQLCP